MPDDLERTPHRLPENLRHFRDTCNVYVLQDGERARLIDAGRGSILEHLSAAGIQRGEWILQTHHYRFQAHGTALPVDEAVARVAAPEHEHHLFADVENFWRNRRIYDNYDVHGTFFAGR